MFKDYTDFSDEELVKYWKLERERQNNSLELIPSENFVSKNVLAALGSVFTNKYAEGYPAKRYYGGNQYIDEIEKLAIERAKELFSAEHVNVQALSGAPANLASYLAVLEPGDSILSMSLNLGGHLSHGHKVTHISKIFHFYHYGIKENGDIDYEEMENLAKKYKVKLILVGYSSYTRDIDYARVKQIADEISAYTMADISHPAGIIAKRFLRNPFDYGFDIVTTTTHKTLRGPRGAIIMCKKELASKIDKSVFPAFQGGPHENNILAKAVAFKEALSNDFKLYIAQVLKNAKTLEKAFKELGYKIVFDYTENHILLLDLRNLNITGKEAQDLLDQVNITVNMNLIPNDPQPARVCSGIRLGTPALTTRGMKEEEMLKIVQLIDDTLKKRRSLDTIRKNVIELSKEYPLNY